MSTRQRLNATCERCGRRIEVHQGRKKAVIVCFDCRYSDPEYLRLRTSNACGTREFAGVSAVESGQENGPDRSVRALQPGPTTTENLESDGDRMNDSTQRSAHAKCGAA